MFFLRFFFFQFCGLENLAIVFLILSKKIEFSPPKKFQKTPKIVFWFFQEFSISYLPHFKY
jgi:hypothetical protein